MKSRASNPKKKREFLEKLAKKNVDWADRARLESAARSDKPPVRPSASSTILPPPITTSLDSIDTPEPQNSSTFMVGSSRESSASERSETNSGISSWQTTATNTAASSIDVYAFRQNADFMNHPNLNQNQRNKNSLLTSARNFQLKEDTPQREQHTSQILEPPQITAKNSNSLQTKPRNPSDHSSPKAPKDVSNMFTISSEISVSGLENPKEDTSHKPINNSSDHFAYVQSEQTSLLKPNKQILRSSSSLTSTDFPSSATQKSLYTKLQTTKNDIIMASNSIKGLNLQQPLNDTSEHSSKPIPFIASSRRINANSHSHLQSPSTPTTLSSGLDSSSYYTSSTHRAAQLERQLAQQQDQLDNTQAQLASIYNKLNHLTGSNSAYVASIPASLITKMHPSRKDVLNLPNCLYTWAKIVDKPFESSMMRTTFLSKQHHGNSLKKRSESHTLKGSRISTATKHPRPDSNARSNVYDIDEDEWWQSLMPPSTFDSTTDSLDSKKYSSLKDNLDLFPWFKPISRIDKQIYYSNKRSNLSSNSNTIKLTGNANSANSTDSKSRYSKPAAQHLVPSSNTRIIIQQVKAYMKDMSKPSELQTDWTEMIYGSSNQNETQDTRKKIPLLSTLEVSFDPRLAPNYLEVLNSSKAELRLASRTALTAARVKIAPPPRLVTNSVATLETWKGRRVPGLLNLNMYTGSTNLPDALQLARAFNKLDNSVDNKNSDKTPSQAHIDEGSLVLRKAKDLASKGMPLIFLDLNEKDYVALHKSILEYYQRVPLTQGGLAPKNVSIASSYSKPALSTKKKSYTDTTMTPQQVIAIPQLYQEQYEYSIARQGNENSNNSRRNKANRPSSLFFSSGRSNDKTNNDILLTHLTTHSPADFKTHSYINSERIPSNKTRNEIPNSTQPTLLEGHLSNKKPSTAFSSSIVETGLPSKKHSSLFRSKNTPSTNSLNLKSWKQTSKPTLVTTNVSVEHIRESSNKKS